MCAKALREKGFIAGAVGTKESGPDQRLHQNHSGRAWDRIEMLVDRDGDVSFGKEGLFSPTLTPVLVCEPRGSSSPYTSSPDLGGRKPDLLPLWEEIVMRTLQL